MGIYIIVENVELSLEEAIKTDEFNIVFGTQEAVNEFNIYKNGSSKPSVYIRSHVEGVSGNNVSHDITIKLTNGKKYTKGKMSGLPFTIYPDKPYAKISDKIKNPPTVSNNEIKFIKEIVKDNYNDIVTYWNCDPNIPEQKQQMKLIEDKIKNKYGM